MTQLDLSHPFANFLYAFGAARKLLERAQERGSLIEGIVLYVSMIDGLLRIAMVLDKQVNIQAPGLGVAVGDRGYVLAAGGVLPG